MSLEPGPIPPNDKEVIQLHDTPESEWSLTPPEGAQLKGEIPQGKLYRVKLDARQFTAPTTKLHEVLDQIVSEISPAAKEKRRILMRKLIRNAANKFPLIGKPSSCFVFRDTQGSAYLDYMAESQSNERDGQTLHTLLREHPRLRPAYTLRNLFGYSWESLLSGHIASVTSGYQTPGVKYLLLLDKFSGAISLSEQDALMLKILSGNGIIPIDAEAKLIAMP